MVQLLEEYSLNALPALQTVFFDGWILRFANGYTKRANSVNPLYNSTKELVRKIKQCEQLYSAKSLETIFKLTTASHPGNLDTILAEQGYRVESPSSVQLLNLEDIDRNIDENVTYSRTITQDWLESFFSFSRIAENHKPVLRSILENIIPDTYMVSLKNQKQIIGCGLGVLQDEYFGLFDIVIKDSHRGQGYGKKLITNILSIGANAGAKYSYLQVLQSNTSAIKLYAGIGYKEVYQYWYRVK